jgi:hypothetical protein
MALPFTWAGPKLACRLDRTLGAKPPQERRRIEQPGVPAHGADQLPNLLAVRDPAPENERP